MGEIPGKVAEHGDTLPGPVRRNARVGRRAVQVGAGGEKGEVLGHGLEAETAKLGRHGARALRRARVTRAVVHGGPEGHVHAQGGKDERIQLRKRFELPVGERAVPADEASHVPVPERRPHRGPALAARAQPHDVAADQERQPRHARQGPVGPADPLVAGGAVMGNDPADLQALHQGRELGLEGQGAAVSEAVDIDDEELPKLRLQEPRPLQ